MTLTIDLLGSSFCSFTFTVQSGPSGERLGHQEPEEERMLYPGTQEQRKAERQMLEENNSPHVHSDGAVVCQCNYDHNHSKLVTSSMIILTKTGLTPVARNQSEQNFMQIHHRVY